MYRALGWVAVTFVLFLALAVGLAQFAVKPLDCEALEEKQLREACIQADGEWKILGTR